MVSSFSLTISANSRFASSSRSSAAADVPSSFAGGESPAQALNSTLLASRCCIEFSSRAISLAGRPVVPGQH